MKKENKILKFDDIASALPDILHEHDFDFPEKLLPAQLNTANIEALYDHSKKIMAMMVGYKELMMMYNCALKQMRTKFEILNTEFNVRYQRNPINSIHTRLKRSASIIEKMQKNSISLSLENIEAHINDAAGIRVICPYADDIYVITEALTKQDDVTLISQKDYIANPKPNGYRSMHLIVAVPVFFAEQTKNIKVEVQIRTIAMDFWATLEHQMRYKQQTADDEAIASELKECAEIIASTDSKMLELRKKIEENTGDQTDDDILFEKMRKIDFHMD